MEKKVLWVGEKNEEGRYVGALIDAGEVEYSVYLGCDYVLIWDEVDGKKAPTIPENIEWDGEEHGSIQEMDTETAREYLDSLVGSESRTAGDWEAADNCLAYSFNEHEFGSPEDWETTKTHTYICNSNRKTIYLGEEESEYELEILDTYNLDYIDYSRNETNREYGGRGEHAKLHKVRVDGGEEGLLWHRWSQWQGNELDQGELVTKEEALEWLTDHPEYDEIVEWLND
jgi:hypothetical protein